MLVRIGDLDLDTARKRVRRGGVMLYLAAAEFAVLELLVVRAGQAVSHAEFVECCWDELSESAEVDAVIAQLRRKLGPPIIIGTAPAGGYIIEG
ncbi:two-component system, OmpR family, copper resistance phosphate regulon response regulator CusR [Amycolatopsis xylanica]|uniref:Two-component system, OmpR family, copper resistance phosphate regulon response regulator CusR n=1 Tax=Amycolatopsis xylanica TaxID=589385 RepID=A0A1H3CNU4_9PSEU|nr:winged helix-turn-helix domain-containing protein [Amycolatopsis xylanica]SDX55710.1 two-component system, OmpR family, copper resistance phosphate regulon response regulator CusR [Amycolatopsis xylanica]